MYLGSQKGRTQGAACARAARAQWAVKLFPLSRTSTIRRKSSPCPVVSGPTIHEWRKERHARRPKPVEKGAALVPVRVGEFLARAGLTKPVLAP